MILPLGGKSGETFLRDGAKGYQSWRQLFPEDVLGPSESCRSVPGVAGFRDLARDDCHPTSRSVVPAKFPKFFVVLFFKKELLPFFLLLPPKRV
jgi:hypothetical protein